MKQFSFRFDVDTHRCAETGVPSLLQLALDYRVPFTFFINPGRAVSRIEFIREWGLRRNKVAKGETLSAYRKLGLQDFMKVSLWNPRIVSFQSSLRQIDSSIHEIGLHGGKNHQSWARHAHEWNEQKLNNEIEWGKRELARVFPCATTMGFASPGFNSPQSLDAILPKHGFRYCADANTLSSKASQPVSRALAYPVTSLFGAPSGVATVEYFMAKSMTRKDIVARIIGQIIGSEESMTIYDHPYFAGIDALDVYKDLVDQILGLGIEIVTMRNQTIGP